MAFWDFFNSDNQASSKDANYRHGLYQKAKSLFPEIAEQELTKRTCIAGLLARVSYSDLNIVPSEVAFIEEAIQTNCQFSKEDSHKLTQLCIEEIKSLAGQENHRYCYELNELLDNNEKYQVLLTLFAVAASDGEVESVESEEIRHITKALLLEHKHYISARASVVDKLKSLKKTT